MKQEHIVVGGGIAGASLAWRLRQEGVDVLLLDMGDGASLVANGIVNPITGRRISLKHKFKLRFAALEEFYTSLKPYLSKEIQLKKDCLLFRSLKEEEMNKLHEKLKEDQELSSVIVDLLSTPPAKEFNSGPGVLTHAQQINVELTLQLIKSELSKQQQYQKAYVDLSTLKKTNTGWRIGLHECRSLTLAQGWTASQIGPFSFLPFSPAKGEVIEVKLHKELTRPDIFFKRYEIFSPLSKTEARFGSTFSWNELNTAPTKSTCDYLKEKLRSMINIPFGLERHLAHVRPATKDRRAFLGAHPHHKNLLIFNGLGSLGLSLAPLYSQQLTQLILKDKQVDEEVDIQRYRSYL